MRGRGRRRRRGRGRRAMKRRRQGRGRRPGPLPTRAMPPPPRLPKRTKRTKLTKRAAGGARWCCASSWGWAAASRRARGQPCAPRLQPLCTQAAHLPHVPPRHTCSLLTLTLTPTPTLTPTQACLLSEDDQPDDSSRRWLWKDSEGAAWRRLASQPLDNPFLPSPWRAPKPAFSKPGDVHRHDTLPPAEPPADGLYVLLEHPNSNPCPYPCPCPCPCPYPYPHP